MSRMLSLIRIIKRVQLRPFIELSEKRKIFRMKPLINSKTFLFAFFFISFQSYKHNLLYCVEDAIITEVKRQIDNEITRFKREWGSQMAIYPEVIYGQRGNRYYIEFLVDQRRCDIFTLLVSGLNVLQRNKEANGFKIITIDSMKEGAIYTLIVQFEEAMGNPKKRLITKGTIYISGEMTSDRPNFRFSLEKTDEISSFDIHAFLEAYRQLTNFSKKLIQKSEANKPRDYQFVKNFSANSNPSNTQQIKQTNPNEALQKLEQLGVTVFMPTDKLSNLDWDYLAGYEKQKRDIEDTVMLALSFPEIYDEITSKTRVKNEPNRPKAVLFEGPPGTGKTTSAKIIAQQVKIPLIYMPIESIMTKYYGESEKRLAEIWEGCAKLGRVIIFIDEIDALAQSREGEMHEASRRILSTLLRKIDSFESSSDVLLICATNRKQDLDAAMLSRLDMSIKFELPDQLSRQAIFQRYAKHLTDEDRKELAKESQGLSGRNISDVCKDAERRWAAKLIRKEVSEKLPTKQSYLDSLKARIQQHLA